MLEIGFSNKSSIDGVVYRFEARFQQSVVVCPVSPLTASVNSGMTNGLFNNGFFVNSANVPSGSCRSYDARIVRVDDGEIVSIMSARVDNI